jgi:GNAT superfamily N-acetyltransferase
MTITIRQLEQADIQPIADAFALLGWDKPASQYERYLAEQETGTRTVLVALLADVFAGYLTVNWQSQSGAFRDTGIPEIQDFNVLPQYRRQGIGTRLLDEAEALAAQRSDVVGIGVGLFSDYGAAQRLYVRRGYIPDGHGLYSHDRVVQYGETVVVDDDLLLNFTKRLR